MKKILLGLLVTGAVGGVAFYATNAFFSDTETSTGNTLQAGAIDLKVDNTCYYNGQACTQGPDDRFYWGGLPNHPSPTPATNLCSCTWKSKNLEEGDLFFDIEDIKPGDWEEDTISLTVENNEAWLCADVHLTSDDDVTCTEPESETGLADPECSAPTPSPGTGELADRVRFLWWADDGDNVLETCEFPNAPPDCKEETTLPSGPLGVLNVSQTAHVTLADSNKNLWSGLPNDPIPQGGDTWYIGKGWCFGRITETPVPQDGLGPTIPITNGPDSPRGGGFTCDGSGEGNETQTDRLTAEISFRAEQARNNEDFLCNPRPL
ncbi:MAG: hypothetical protein G01um101416_208 [Microgenomates group bacterium Gr01-1014_16]|nr:MAG: hypothetical protein G01um101416_208 [Microgenomates group bacterium Gr01-1014_16]